MHFQKLDISKLNFDDLIEKTENAMRKINIHQIFQKYSINFHNSQHKNQTIFKMIKGKNNDKYKFILFITTVLSVLVISRLIYKMT